METITWVMQIPATISYRGPPWRRPERFNVEPAHHVADFTECRPGATPTARRSSELREMVPAVRLGVPSAVVRAKR